MFPTSETRTASFIWIDHDVFISLIFTADLIESLATHQKDTNNYNNLNQIDPPILTSFPLLSWTSSTLSKLLRRWFKFRPVAGYWTGCQCITGIYVCFIWKWSISAFITNWANMMRDDFDRWCWQMMLIDDADRWCWQMMLIDDADRWCWQMMLTDDGNECYW